jgi:hypothetical protein
MKSACSFSASLVNLIVGIPVASFGGVPSNRPAITSNSGVLDVALAGATLGLETYPLLTVALSMGAPSERPMTF